MRYLKEVPYIDRKGKAFQIEDAEVGPKPHDATIGELLKITLNNYKPQQGKFWELAADLRKLNKCTDILEDGLPDSGYWAFEDSDWTVLCQTVKWVVPVMSFNRELPGIEDALEKVVAKLPVAAAEAKEREEVKEEVA